MIAPVGGDSVTLPAICLRDLRGRREPEVRHKAEAWRPIHSRYVQNNPSTEMISGSLLHDRADEHNQLPDDFVASMEQEEHKQMEYKLNIMNSSCEKSCRW